MPEKVTKLTVFVASPGDVSAERNHLPDVVNEINRTIGAQKNIVLELVRWETHAWPGIGEDAQDVINQEIGPADIFIGIMWKRLGTETRRAPSGTAEEFERAYEFWKAYKRPHIMFYFKNTPFFPKNPEELAQMQKVMEFRNKLEKSGLLYWDFEKPAEFTNLVREHLSRLVLRQETSGATQSQTPTVHITVQTAQLLSRTPAIILERDKLALQSILENQYSPLSVSYYADDKLAFSSRDGYVRIVDLDSQIHQQLHTSAVAGCVEVYGQKKLAAISYTKVYLMDLESGEERSVTIDPQASSHVLSWSPNGRYLAVGATNVAKIFTSNLEQIAEHHVGGKYGAAALTWTRDGNILYVGLGNGELWRLTEPFDRPDVLFKGSASIIGLKSAETDDRIACLWRDGRLETRRDSEVLASIAIKPMSAWIASGPKLAWCLGHTLLACATGMFNELIFWHFESNKVLSCQFDRKPLAIATKPSDGKLVIALDQQRKQDGMLCILDLSSISTVLSKLSVPEDGKEAQPHLLTADWSPLLDLVTEQQDGGSGHTLKLDIPELENRFARYEENIRKTDAEPGILRDLKQYLLSARKRADNILNDLLWTVKQMREAGYNERDILVFCDRVVSFSVNSILGRLNIEHFPAIESLEEFVAFTLGYNQDDLLYLGFDAQDGRGVTACVPFDFLTNINQLISIGEALSEKYNLTTMRQKVSAACQLFHEFDYVFSYYDQIELWILFVLPLTIVRYSRENVIIHPSGVSKFGLA